ncbi:phosphoribosylamine--glycine ligase [Bacteroidetes bacterium endosymbiont of Geopemphigus sp.]|uniref:phosphoribosylamine--glycine ligase n=1 Tax=Bacteroidetes bacterium endosymbiont of Geopemphigus sp. TaxID=2047937 RepID=UPI002AD4BD0F|nr:phosphoribosylglycinamide synthetase C domain-containing protein [Bacteroidetes bacterium endosymbiont of Geopemphigus sp.]
MKKYGVRTAAYAYFSDAVAYLDELNYPVVIKASGLASGKGVIITQDKEFSFKALELMMKDKIFSPGAADEVIIEECLQGKEASVLSVFNGKEISPFLSAKDHKKIGEGETGSNTGGIGVVATNPHISEAIWQDFDENILTPILQGLSAENLSFASVIFVGLMITEIGVYLLEDNLRTGDPEKQSIFTLMESDFLETIQKAIKRESIEISSKPAHSCVAVMDSGGYPRPYRKEYEITGLETLHTSYYIAGAEKENDRWITSAGRVLNIIGIGTSAQEVYKNAYEAVKKISFTDTFYRKGIGLS